MSDGADGDKDNESHHHPGSYSFVHLDAAIVAAETTNQGESQDQAAVKQPGDLRPLVGGRQFSSNKPVYRPDQADTDRNRY